MFSQIAQSRPITHAAQAFDLRSLFGNVLMWIVQADQRYRLSRRLDETPDHLLDDMGITRAELDRALGSKARF